MARTDFKSVDDDIATHPVDVQAFSSPVPVRLIERMATLRAKEAAERAKGKGAGRKKSR